MNRMVAQRLGIFAWISIFAAVVMAFAPTVWAATYTVSITDSQFIPSTLKIAPGDSISFINTTDATQSARTTVSSGFNTGNIGPGQSKLITVVNAGTYSYSSQYNSALTGTVEVTTSTSTTSTTTSTTSASTTGVGGTSQPATTQEQPVSGVEDVLYAVLAVGLSCLGIGMYWQHRLGGQESEVVELTPISVQLRQDD